MAPFFKLYLDTHLSILMTNQIIILDPYQIEHKPNRAILPDFKHPHALLLIEREAVTDPNSYLKYFCIFVRDSN